MFYIFAYHTEAFFEIFLNSSFQLSKDTSSSAVYLSLAQSLFPLGQGISQPIASVMVKKLRQIKVVLISSTVIAIAGNVTYMAASKVDSVALIILGRALAGLGAGERGQLFVYQQLCSFQLRGGLLLALLILHSLLGSGGVAYGFIGANTSREKRTKFMSYFRVTCMTGVMTSTIGKVNDLLS